MCLPSTSSRRTAGPQKPPPRNGLPPQPGTSPPPSSIRHRLLHSITWAMPKLLLFGSSVTSSLGGTIRQPIPRHLRGWPLHLRGWFWKRRIRQNFWTRRICQNFWTQCPHLRGCSFYRPRIPHPRHPLPRRAPTSSRMIAANHHQSPPRWIQLAVPAPTTPN